MSSLKLNLDKSEIWGIGVKKGHSVDVKLSTSVSVQLILFGTEVKLTACADDTTLFLRNLSSLEVLLLL